MSYKTMKNVISADYANRGGAYPPHLKRTAESATERMPVPAQVAVAMQQHIGAPCLPCVKKGDKVLVGTKLGDSDKPVSAPIYSGVSGEVVDITELMLANGSMTQAIIIDTDGEQTMRDDFAPVELSGKDDLIRAVRECGLVGLGGAGFPTHIKLNPKQKIDTLIINGAECEPYITADYREMMEFPQDIIDGICILMKQLEIDKTIVVIEDNKPKAIELLAKTASICDMSDKIKIMSVESKYPKGAEKITIYIATGRRVPMGGLPADTGCIVMNISSVSQLAKYIKTGVPLFEKRLTVDGSAIKEPKNVFAPVGTYLKDIIEFAGGCKNQPKKLIMGGPMMGNAVPDDSLPIMKSSNAVLALSDSEAYPKPLSECIRCGRCVSVCPMRLLPTRIEAHLKTKNIDALKADNVLNCIECGCCAFECPASRPLVQVMRQSKKLVK